MENGITYNKEHEYRNIEELKAAILFDCDLHAIAMSEMTLGLDGILVAERVYNSLIQSKAYYIDYEKILEFTQSLLSIEGLLDRFFKSSNKFQELFWRKCREYPDVINGLTLALTAAKISDEDLQKQYYEEIKKSYKSDTSDFLSAADDLSSALKKDFDTHEFIEMAMYALRNIHSDEVVLELMRRWVKEMPTKKLTDFILVLENGDSISDYPLEWSVAVLRGDGKH